MIVTKLDSTKKFIDEIGELGAVSGHMLGAPGVQIPQNNLDNLQSIREEDGTLEQWIPQIEWVLIGFDPLAPVEQITPVECNRGWLESFGLWESTCF
ncbi:hypothetical protein Tco_0920928 [Tanacetum coccineum]